MSTPAFTLPSVSISIRSSSSLPTLRTPRRARPFVFSPSCQHRHPFPHQLPVHEQVPAIEERFRRLDADAVANLASAALSTVASGTQLCMAGWRHVVDVLEKYNIRGDVLSRLVDRLGVLPLLQLDAGNVAEVLLFLSDYLRLKEEKRNSIVSQKPDLLKSPLRVTSAVHALERAGLTLFDIRKVVQRWPGLLLLDATRIHRAVNYLRSQQVGFNYSNLRALLRRSPWLLVYDVDYDMAPTVFYLREALKIESLGHVDHYIRASPLLLGTSRADMQHVVWFLLNNVRLTEKELKAVVRAFPALLTFSVEYQLSPVTCYLRDELGLSAVETARALRAFPALLALDVDHEIKSVVEFFKSRGVQNVGRIVSRLPPVLGYDLETNIIPKMEYIEKILRLSVFDILQFPGYFSYPLETCIEPRTKFLLAKGISVSQAGLSNVVSLTDENFCKRISHSTMEQYRAFRKACLEKKPKPKGTNQTYGAQRAKFSEYNRTDSSVNGVPVSVAPSGRITSLAQKRKRRFRASLSRMPWTELR